MALTLAEVETAIETILTSGQSVTLPTGVTVNRANLSDLMMVRDRLRAESGPTGLGRRITQKVRVVQGNPIGQGGWYGGFRI